MMVPRFFLSALFLSTGLSEEKLRLVDWAGLDEIPLTERCVQEFENLHPSLTVLYEPNPGRQYEEKILTALAANEPPDVFLLDSKLIPTFTNKKVLLDLSPFLSTLQIDTAQWYPPALGIARRGSALYAFPKGFTPLMVYFNKKLFSEAGLAFPSADWTWEEYLGYAKELTRDLDGDNTPEQYGTAFTNYYFYWIPWVWTGGGDVVSPDGASAQGYLDSPHTESTLQFLIDLRAVHKVAPDVGSWTQTERTGANTQLFASGKIAMIVDGHWRMPKFLQYIEAGTLDVGVVGLPRCAGGGKANVMYESGWCVPVNSKHPEAAVRLAAFMAGEAAARIRTARKLEISAVISVAKEAASRDVTGMEQAFIGEIPFCRQPWGAVIERFSEIEWTLQDAVDEVMLNGQQIHDTMTRYALRVDQQLETIRENQSFEFIPIREHSGALYFLAGVTVVVSGISLLLYVVGKRKNRNATGTALTFLAPSLLHLTVFIFTPIVFSAYLSLHRWDIVVPHKPFVGLTNFREMLGDELFWNALKNTLLYTLNVPLGMVVSLSVALLMHKKMRGIAVLRTMYFLPSVTSFVAIALVWMWIYHPSFGIANFALGLLGVPPMQWLNASGTAMVSLMIFSIWMGVGYQMVIFLAGLQAIPEELYSAARIDGASNKRLFWHITLPLLKPTTLFVLVTSIIGSFQVFTAVYVMTAGGPVRSTDVIVYHIYQAAWEQLRMGYASAMSWLLFVIIMIATWLQFRLFGRKVEYS